MPLGVEASEPAIPLAPGTPAVPEGIMPAAPVKGSSGAINEPAVPPSTELTTPSAAPPIAASIGDPLSAEEVPAIPVLCPGEWKEGDNDNEASKSFAPNESSRSCSKGDTRGDPVRFATALAFSAPTGLAGAWSHSSCPA